MIIQLPQKVIELRDQEYSKLYPPLFNLIEPLDRQVIKHTKWKDIKFALRIQAQFFEIFGAINWFSTIIALNLQKRTPSPEELFYNFQKHAGLEKFSGIWDFECHEIFETDKNRHFTSENFLVPDPSELLLFLNYRMKKGLTTIRRRAPKKLFDFLPAEEATRVLKQQ